MEPNDQSRPVVPTGSPVDPPSEQEPVSSDAAPAEGTAGTAGTAGTEADSPLTQEQPVGHEHPALHEQSEPVTSELDTAMSPERGLPSDLLAEDTPQATADTPLTAETAVTAETPATAVTPATAPTPSMAATPGMAATPPAAAVPAAGTAAGAPGSELPWTPGIVVASLGAVLTIVAAFLTWASVEVTSRAGNFVGGGTRTATGIEGDRLGKATLVLGIAALLLALFLLLPATRSWGWIALAVLGALIIAFALIDLASITDSGDLQDRIAQVCGQVTCEAKRTAGVGVWLTVAGGAAVVVGSLLHLLLLRRSRHPATPERAPVAVP